MIIKSAENKKGSDQLNLASNLSWRSRGDLKSSSTLEGSVRPDKNQMIKADHSEDI